MSKSLPPFSCIHTPEIPDLLAQLGCTLVLSTYQAGKVIFISARRDGLVQLARAFQKPMGMAVHDQRLAIATRHEVVVLADVPALTGGKPEHLRKYDGLFVPRAVYFSGELDLHDLALGDHGLYAVNTRFSCISRINERYSFEPYWRPPFISELCPDDRCHLNGMAMADGKPLYATALGETDTAGGWRPAKLTGGILMHLPTGEVLLRNLPMPHSPRVFDNRLYFLNSATGELMTADPASRTCETINRLPGFARGLARHGDYLFVGVSRIRGRHMFNDMPVARGNTFSGIVAVHLPSGRLAGSIQYLASCEEIYDVQVLAGRRRPGILNHTTDLHRHILTVPGQGFWNDSKQNPALKTKLPITSAADYALNKGKVEPPAENCIGRRSNQQLLRTIPTAVLTGSLLFGAAPGAALAAPFFAPQSGTFNPLDSVALDNSSSPIFVDIDGDSDLDAFVIEEVGTLFDKEILFFRNVGTPAAPDLALAGPDDNPLAPIELGNLSVLTFVDIDNDGDFDAFIGDDYSGTVKFYENIGSPHNPQFNGQPTVPNPLESINLGSYGLPAPVFADIDNDGDFDLFLGEENGTVFYYENLDATAEHNSPDFVERTGANNPLADVNVAERSTPAFADADNDGDLDVFIGGGRGEGVIAYYENIDTSAGRNNPTFAERIGAANPFANLEVRGFPFPAFADIDQDGDADALVGNFAGTINYFRNIDLHDAILSLQALTGTFHTMPIYKGIEVSGDGKTGLAEVVYILQKVSGKR